jgi:hypothetical protein
MMDTNITIKVDNDYFNEFLQLNRTKINSITPINPIILKDDEWISEVCWDNETIHEFY